MLTVVKRTCLVQSKLPSVRARFVLAENSMAYRDEAQVRAS